MQNKALIAALQWHLDAGADEALGDEPVNAFSLPAKNPDKKPDAGRPSRQPAAIQPEAAAAVIEGSAALRAEAARLAQAANTLEDLRAAIAAFDGIALKKTAMNLVFSDGNPAASVMVVGEAPGGDDDRLGKAFAGGTGQLLDRILASIGLSRGAEEAAQAAYLANILNWRPPGNRTPTPAEIDISLPFIERHILLVRPRLLVLAGGVAAKALLNSDASMARLRGFWHDYRPRTLGVAENAPAIPAIVTYHPEYLISTPAQKRAVWQDMLAVKKELEKLKMQ